MLVDGSLLVAMKNRKWAYSKVPIKFRGYFHENEDPLVYFIANKIISFHAVARLLTGYYPEFYSIIINTALQIPTYKRHEL